MANSNVRNKTRDNRLTSKGPFHQPRQDYLQDSVSQCNTAADKDSLCKVSDYEVSLHSKSNLPNISGIDCKGRAIYWLYKHNLSDGQSVREKSKKQKNQEKLVAIRTLIASKNPDDMFKHFRLRGDLCKLRDLFLKGENSEIKIKETYNSYLNLDDIYALHLYLKENEPLCKDQYRNLALNLEIKRNLLKKIQESKQKGKEVYVLPQTSHTNIQKNQRLQLEKYLSKFNASTNSSKSKPEPNPELEGGKITNILTRSGLSIADLEHILNQINFIIKGEHFDQETEAQKTMLQRYLHSISTESSISKVKKEKNLCVLDKKISEGLQNSMRDLIRQVLCKPKTSSLEVESRSTNQIGSNSLRKCQAKSNILTESDGKDSSTDLKRGIRGLSMMCFKCESSENTSSDENLNSNLKHEGDVRVEVELAAKRISQELSNVKRNQPQVEELPKSKSDAEDNGEKIYIGDAFVSGKKEKGQRTKRTKCRSQNLDGQGNWKEVPNVKRVRTKYKEHRNLEDTEQYDVRKKGPNIEGGRTKYMNPEDIEHDVRKKLPGVEGVRTKYKEQRYLDGKEQYDLRKKVPNIEEVRTKYKECSNLEDTEKQTDVTQEHFDNRHISSQTDRPQRHHEQSSNTENSLVVSKEKKKLDSAEQYRLEDVWESCVETYRNQFTQYQPELFVQSSPKKPSRATGITTLIQPVDAKSKEHHGNQAVLYTQDSFEKPSRAVDIIKIIQAANANAKEHLAKKREREDEKRSDSKSKKNNEDSNKYSHPSQAHKIYLSVNKKKENYCREETKESAVNGIKEDLSYLCFEDEFKISNDSFCDRPKTDSSVKLQGQQKEAQKPTESLDDLIDPMETTRKAKGKIWIELNQRCERPPERKLMKSYREDISRKMARSYDYLISSKKKKLSGEDIAEHVEDSEELITRIDYENYVREKYLVNRISTKDSDVFKHQTKGAKLQDSCEKENNDFGLKCQKNKFRKDSGHESTGIHGVSQHQRSGISRRVGENDGVGKNQCRGISGILSERESNNADDYLKRSRRRQSDDFECHNIDGDEFRCRNQSSCKRGDVTNIKEGNVAHLGTFNEEFDYKTKRSVPQNFTERENVGVKDDFKYRSIERTRRSSSVNDDVDDNIFNYHSKRDSPRKICDIIINEKEMSKRDSSTITQKSTMTNSEINIYTKSTNDLMGLSKINQFGSDTLEGSMTSLERFILDERACATFGNAASYCHPDIPIFKGNCEFARLRSTKINKSTQMFEHVTENDLYTLQWIHDNLFAIDINPHTLIVDEKIKEVSEESRLS